MSILSRAESNRPAEGPIDTASVAEHAYSADRYLTDGVNLYRSLGAIAGALGQMVGLEDCLSLDVALLPLGELRTRGLRAVIPAGEERRD